MAESGRRRGTNLAVATLGIAVSVAFAAIAIRDVQWGDVGAAFQQSNYWWLVPALIVFAIAVTIRILRWQYLFVSSSRPSFRATATALLVGMFINNVVPARAGDAARVFVLRRRARTSVGESTATVAIERAWDVLSLLVLLFVLSPWFPHVRWLNAAAIFAVALIAALIGLIVVLHLYGSRPIRWALAPLHRFGPLTADHVAAGADAIVSGFATVQRLRLAMLAFALTTLSWLVTAASFWLVMLAFDLHLSFLAAVLVLIAVGLGMILPSSPGALGVFEAATLLALTPYDISQSRGLSYAIVLHAVNSVPFIVVGGIALHTEGLATLRRVLGRVDA